MPEIIEKVQTRIRFCEVAVGEFFRHGDGELCLKVSQDYYFVWMKPPGLIMKTNLHDYVRLLQAKIEI